MSQRAKAIRTIQQLVDDPSNVGLRKKMAQLWRKTAWPPQTPSTKDVDEFIDELLQESL